MNHSTLDHTLSIACHISSRRGSVHVPISVCISILYHMILLPLCRYAFPMSTRAHSLITSLYAAHTMYPRAVSWSIIVLFRRSVCFVAPPILELNFWNVLYASSGTYEIAIFINYRIALLVSNCRGHCSVSNRCRSSRSDSSPTKVCESFRIIGRPMGQNIIRCT